MNAFYFVTDKTIVESDTVVPVGILKGKAIHSIVVSLLSIFLSIEVSKCSFLLVKEACTNLTKSGFSDLDPDMLNFSITVNESLSFLCAVELPDTSTAWSP